MTLELRSLRHAVALARHLNYRRAAAELGITQSTLTRSIQAIEHNLQARLFDRGRGGVSLTALGRDYVRHAEAVLLSAHHMAQMVARSAGGDGGAVSFGIGPLVARAILTPLIRDGLTRAPHLHAGVLVRNAGELMPLLLAEQIEFFIAAASEATVPARVRTTVLGQFPVALLVRPGHPLLRRTALPAGARFPLVASSVQELPKRVPASLAAYIAPVASVVSDDGQLLAELTQASDAVWLSSALAAAAELRAGTLAALPLPAGATMQFPVASFTLEGRSQSPAATWLLKAARSLIRRLEAGK